MAESLLFVLFGAVLGLIVAHMALLGLLPSHPLSAIFQPQTRDDTGQRRRWGRARETRGEG